MEISPQRIIEIWVPDYGKVGSGFALTPHLVLTARHVVDDSGFSGVVPGRIASKDEAEETRDTEFPIRVRSLPSEKGSFDPSSADGRFRHARIVWPHGDARYDAAILQITEGDGFELGDDIAWARITGGATVKCTGVGFPSVDSQSVDGRTRRESRQFRGEIAPLTHWKGASIVISVTDSMGSKPTLDSSWAGLSGAAVLSAGAHADADSVLLAVAIADPSPTDPSRLELWALPVTVFAEEPDLLELVQRDGGSAAWQEVELEPEPNEHREQHPVLRSGLPAAPEGGLVGREGLLRDAIKRLRGGSDVVFLSGLPGVGKTALAVELAKAPRVEREFSDGILWLAVGDPEGSSLSHWRHRISEWCRVLGVSPDRVGDAISRQDDAALVGLASTAIGDRRMLLVFDDVWLEDDARLFKRIGTDCRRVLTTRIPDVGHRFTQPAFHVPDLTYSESVELLELHCPGAHARFGSELDAVLEHIAGLPLTLTVVGTVLYVTSSRGGREAGVEYLRELSDAGTTLKLKVDDYVDDDRLPRLKEATLRAVIELSTNRLTPEQRLSLAALAVFPPKANTFSREAAKRVVKKPDHFDAITQQGLVEPPDARGRFALHQAIADFAGEGKRGSSAAYRRLMRYLIDHVEAVTKGDDWAGWVGELRPEADNVRAALAWAVRAKETRLAARLMTTLWPYFYRTSQFQRGLDLASSVLDLGDPDDATREDRVLRSQLFNDAGNYAYNLADFAAAERLHTTALRIRQEEGEEGLTAGSFNNLSLIRRARGDYPEALRLISLAEEINLRTRHKRWRLWYAMNLNNRGLTLAADGKPDESTTAQEEAVREFASLDDRWGVAMARTDLAEALIAKKRWGDARALANEVMVDRVDDEDHKAIAAVLRVESAIELGTGSPTKAVDLLLESLRRSALVGDRLGQGATLERLVPSAVESGDMLLAGRAMGALDAYQTTNGGRSTLASATAVRNAWERVQASDDAERAGSARETSFRMACEGLVHLLDAVDAVATG